MQFVKHLLVAALGGALAAGPVLAQTSTLGTGTSGSLPGGGTSGSLPGSGTSGSVLRPSDPGLPPSTRQSTPSTPNTGIGGSVSGGIPGTLGGTPYSTGGSVTGGIPGTLGGTAAGGGSSQSNTSIGGAGISTTPTTPSTVGGSSTGAIGNSTPGVPGGTSGGALGGTSSGALGSGTTGGSTGTIR